MQIDGLEIIRRAWFYMRENRYLWPLAFFIALAGGSSQGFSLWVQSPIMRGLTGYSPMHQIGERVTDFARGHAIFWVLFIAAGAAVGLALLALGAFAQASAIGAVGEIELGREGDLRTSLRWGRHSFVRFFSLIVGYLLVLAVVSFPAYIFTWAFKGGLVFPCVGWLILASGFLVVSVFASMMLELTGRFLVLEDRGIVESLHMAWILFKERWRDVAVIWLYVLVITLVGMFAMAMLMALLATPLVWVFTLAARHHNAFTIALSMLAFLFAWAIAAALGGVFAITGSAVWTMTFLELEPGAH